MAEACEQQPIIAVVGMCGSGKSLVTGYLKEKGWNVIHFGSITMRELEKRGLPKNETNERSVREELRSKYGVGAYAVLSLPLIMESRKCSLTVIDGLYSWTEYRLLKKEFGDRLFIVAVIADRSIRYERLAVRSVRPLTRQEAELRDFAEIENLEKGGPIAIADFFIDNGGPKEMLFKSVDRILHEIFRQKS